MAVCTVGQLTVVAIPLAEVTVAPCPRARPVRRTNAVCLCHLSAAGAIAMSLITSLLTFVRVDSNYQTAVTGLLLIFVLALNVFTEKRKGV